MTAVMTVLRVAAAVITVTAAAVIAIIASSQYGNRS
jgi:hypothetical protein